MTNHGYFRLWDKINVDVLAKRETNDNDNDDNVGMNDDELIESYMGSKKKGKTTSKSPWKNIRGVKIFEKDLAENSSKNSDFSQDEFCF